MANHLRARQSARVKSTIYLCGILLIYESEILIITYITLTITSDFYLFVYMRRKYPLLLLELEITHRDAQLRAHKKLTQKHF